jgi:tetratricopeptide (TPR) repeat protein
MEDQLQYIDDFFQGRLSPEEEKVFEERITADPAFAANVAFYISSKQTARNIVDEEKKKRYKEIYTATNGNHKKEETGKLRPMYYAVRVALVAAIVTAIIFLVFRDKPTAQSLANSYINTNYKELSVTMGRETEIERATNLYNQGKYSDALAGFENIMRKDSSSFQAVQYAGIAALRIPDYDKALQYFKNLEGFKAQFANPAVLLQAVTLLQRNQPGDEAQAQLLLQKVIDENLDGKPTAEKLLRLD